MNRLPRILALVMTLMLGACVSDEGGTVVYRGDESGEPAVESPGKSTDIAEDRFVRQRILADMLYEARLAYEDNRLMSPAGNNAYDGYRAILDFDPENEVARQGIRDIVLRYIALADSAIQVGQYDNAGDLLNRARRIDRASAELAEADRRLADARSIQRDEFILDPDELSSRSLEIMVELGEIGEYIRRREATFLINARTDEEGRWIYQTMRQAVGGYRLRGNIAIDSEPRIHVAVPGS